MLPHRFKTNLCVGVWLTCLLLLSNAHAQIRISAATVSEADFILGEQAASYSFTIEGTTPGTSRAEAEVKPYWYIIYATGTDIYGNPFYQVIEQGLTQTLYGPTNPPDGARTEATSQTLSGRWGTGDPTLINYYPLRPVPARYPAHRIFLALYGDGDPATPPSEPPLDDATFASPDLSRAAGAIYFYTDGGPDLAIDEVTYNAGSYTGGDIIRMTTKWRNNALTLIPGEVYKIHNYLTENAAIEWRPPADPLNPDDSVRPDNDDFLLSEFTIAGDRPVVSPVDLTPITPDGASIVRKVEVVPVGPLAAYGIPNRNPARTAPFYGSTLRVYQPQPADGYLDVGEVVSVTVEVKVPENYTGTYFVAGRIDPENTVPEPPNLVFVGSDLFLEIQDPALRRPDNNTLISNASAKITIDGPTTSPTVEAVSAIAFQDGEYIQGGGETSNQSSVSADGNLIAFSSAARNLLVPPPLAEAFIRANGRGADMRQFPSFVGNVPYGPISDYLTSGQQIFYRLRQTRENYLASGLDGIAANANCFNPSISSSTGRYIAFDTRANNLGQLNTGNRSLIYITDTQSQTIRAIRPDANGDCFNPSVSADGRFVAFESVATNLDAAKPIPAGNTSQQIYLHDRDVDGAGPKNFDEVGNTATYLVSVNNSGAVANATCLTPSLGAWEPSRTGVNTMYVAYTSFASNLPNGGGGEQVYRVAVDVGASSPGAKTVDLVSCNSDGTVANRPQGAPNGSIEPSISGDGLQVAFSSSADNLVYNPSTGAWDGDTNLVPDVFVRDFTTATTVRVSESLERVATGIISFVSPTPPPYRSNIDAVVPPPPGNLSLVNLPQNNPQPGDTLTITSGGVTETFEFGPAPNVPIGPDVPVVIPQPPDLPQFVMIGKDVCTTRDNLVNAINASGLQVVASATTPTAVPGAAPPNMAITASIYLRSLVPGETGNGTITFTGVAPVVADTDLTGGGTQASDAPLAVQGVPAGSNQPSISEDGRVVAFRTIAGNLDVQALTPENDIPGGPPYTDLYPPSPRQGELIRPVRFPASNVYVRNRSVDESLSGGAFDLPGNVSTTKISVNNFGYPTTVSAQQSSGFGAYTTAANQAPAVGGDGRIISFSSGSEVFGGLVFGRNNLEPLDFQNARDVYVYDSQIVGIAPPPTASRPEVTLLSPTKGLRVQAGSTIALAASVIPKLGKSISSVQFYVNGAAVGAPLTSESYSLTYRLANPGQYVIRVVATDSRGITGIDSAIVTAGPPEIGTSPLVTVTQPPSQVSNYVVGSDLVFNATAEDAGTGAVFTAQVGPGGAITAVNRVSGGSGYSVNTKVFFEGGGGTGAVATVTVDPTGSITAVNLLSGGSGYTSAPNVSFSEIESVTFFLSGEPIPGIRGFDGNWYASRRPSKTGTNSFFASALDVDGNTGISEISTIVFWGIGDTFPSVEILRNNPGLPAVAGGTYPLRARVTFQSPGISFDADDSVVLFYADGVYIGLGQLQDDDTYLLNWRLPQTPRSYSKIYAYLSGPNFFFLADGGEDGGAPTSFASVVVRSKNFLTLSTIDADPLTISLTKPANNATNAPGVPLLLEATAEAPAGQGTIAQVEFYQNGELIAPGDIAFPYQANFTPPSPGRYILSALAYSTAGVIEQSAPVTNNVVSGNAPTSFLTTSTSATATATVSGGQINTPLTITRAGSGYTIAPEVRFVGGGGSNAVAAATINTNSGSVTNIAVSPAGSGYATAPTVVIDPPPVAVSSNSTVLLQASAADTDGTIRQVDFLQNGVIVGSATGSPYNFTLPVTAAGRYELVARATDNLGNVTDSPVIVLNGTSGAAPTVSIVNPANTTPVTEVTPGIPVAVTVNASDTDGSVARVDLIVNGVVVGFSTQAPYIFTDAGQFSGGSNTTFTPTSEGTYVIVARATDNLGNVTDSAAVTVRAKSAIPVGVAPTVQITQPIGEIYYVTGSSLFLNARATDAPPGEVDPDSVDFTVNGLAIPGAVIGQIGNDYGVRYTPTTPFTIDTIRAQATDDDGNTTYSQPNYTVLTLAQAPLPQVQMLDLLPSTPLDAGGVIKLRAEAFFPPTASQQSRVEFYANNVYVGTATQDATNPRLYTLDWQSPETPAAYIIETRAVALNFQSNTSDDNVIEYFGSVISDNSIAVNTIPGTAPDVEITAPANGSTVAVGQPLTIRATAFVPSPSGPSVTEVTSPQAGTVTSVRVAVGQAIIVGTPLVDIQVAPGFSGTVSSTLVGTVKSIKVVPGSAVTVGSVLLEVIPVTTVTAPSATAGGTVTSVVPVGTLVQAGSPLVGVTLPGGFTGTINSPITGVVTQVSVALGDTLTAGQDVARIEPGGGSSGTITSVEFYANGVLLGVDDAAPYSIDFTPTSVGLYNLNAIAYSNAGLVSTSATISISATLGSAPVVTITRPTQATATATLGTGLTAGQVTAISVGQLGSGYTTAPLVTLSAPPPGGVQATATAVLGTGASAGRVTSYTITNAGVGYTAAPTVTVAAPSGTLGSSLLVQASVSDSDGIITQVEFLVNGLVVQTLTAAPYSYNLPLASTGTYLLQVRATDNSGNVGVSAVEQFIVNQGSPPSVSITSPLNGATVSAGLPLTVTANASDTDGSVVSVTFFQNGTQIGEPDTQAPYSATFTPGSPGQYNLVALAQDNSGNLTQSTPVVVTVPSTVVTTSVVSPTNGASFTLGTPVILTATASTTAGATISSVRFEVNSQPVGNPITSAPYTASFVPTALGSYTVRAIATDTSGGTGVSAPVTFTVNNPVGSAPSIWLSQPSQGNYLTAGSSVFLNYTTFDTEGEIDPATLRIFVNGVALTNPAPQRIGPDGNTFGVRWNPGVTGTYVVSAQVSDFDGNTASSGTSTINVLPAQKSVPQVTIEPFVSASQYISVGLPIELRAKAKFFANTDPQVEFYANGVFVGTGVAGASNSDGSVSYSFVWTPDVAGTAITLTARAVGINFEQTEFVTPPGSTDTTIIRRNVYASSISSNRPTPPVTDLTINQVPADPTPGSNEAFVKFIFPTIFNRPATYAEYIYYVNQLQPFGNPATSSARATVIQELMGTVEYNSSYNVVYSFYYRLGLTPTRAAAATQIDVVKNNTAAETGFATHTTAQPQAPNLPTLGMSLAAQNLLATLGSQTTVGLTPNVTKPLSQFSNIEFLNWLIPKLGGQAFNPSTMVTSMNTYSPQLRRQGGALAFLTQLYATYAAINQNIADSRPTAVGPENPNFRQDNLNYDAKLKGITINFLLTGAWSTSTAPLSNSMLASLLTSSAAAAKPVVTSGNASGDVAEYFTYQIEATNSPGGYTASNLPTWLRLNAETGLLTGRPGLGDDGTYLNVKIGAQNWAGEGTKFITISIAPALPPDMLAMLRAKYGYPSDRALAFGLATLTPTASSPLRAAAVMGSAAGDGGAAQVSFKMVPGGVELVWTRLKNSADYGVSYHIQQTAGLSNGWTPVTLAPGQVPQPVNDGVSVPDVDDYERVRVTLPISGSKGFYRVKATVPQ